MGLKHQWCFIQPSMSLGEFPIQHQINNTYLDLSHIPKKAVVVSGQWSIMCVIINHNSLIENEWQLDCRTWRDTTFKDCHPFNNLFKDISCGNNISSTSGTPLQNMEMDTQSR